MQFIKKIRLKIAIGNDHAGYEMKMVVLEWLKCQGFEVANIGTNSSESMDYPDIAHPDDEAVEREEFDLGVLLFGSGQGVSFTANKHQGICAALCWKAEIAKLAREHNNANILCLPGRFLTPEESFDIVKNFLETPFAGGRHQKRIDKVPVKSNCFS